MPCIDQRIHLKRSERRHPHTCLQPTRPWKGTSDDRRKGNRSRVAPREGFRSPKTNELCALVTHCPCTPPKSRLFDAQGRNMRPKAHIFSAELHNLSFVIALFVFSIGFASCTASSIPFTGCSKAAPPLVHYLNAVTSPLRVVGVKKTPIPRDSPKPWRRLQLQHI